MIDCTGEDSLVRSRPVDPVALSRSALSLARTAVNPGLDQAAWHMGGRDGGRLARVPEIVVGSFRLGGWPPVTLDEGADRLGTLLRISGVSSDEQRQLIALFVGRHTR